MKLKRLAVFIMLLIGYSTFATLIMALITLLTGRTIWGIDIVHVGFFLAGYFFNYFLDNIALPISNKINS